MYFRVRSRSPVTFKMKLYVTRVNNSFQLLLFFFHKELHLRCCKGLELNIVTWSTKILKRYQGSPSLFHLMCAITCAYTSTCTTTLMCAKNSMHHFCLWHSLSGILERRKMKEKTKTSGLIVAGVILETEGSTQKTQGHFFTTKKLKRTPLICPPPIFMASLQLFS